MWLLAHCRGFAVGRRRYVLDQRRLDRLSVDVAHNEGVAKVAEDAPKHAARIAHHQFAASLAACGADAYELAHWPIDRHDRRVAIEGSRAIEWPIRQATHPHVWVQRREALVRVRPAWLANLRLTEQEA